MENYDARKDLAPRDIVARSIDAEMKKHGDLHVYLDATQIDPEKLQNHFPTIYNKCLSIGIDITKNYIPVVPAAHYLCGGINVDENARTSIVNLYASGECSSTGLHGANRLASNSLIEALVFSHRAYLKGVEDIYEIKYQQNVPDWDDEGTTMPNEQILVNHTKAELQSILSDYVGIVRTDLRLKRALSRLKLIYEESEELYKKSKLTISICELRNLRGIAYLITRSAVERNENVGLHFNSNNKTAKIKAANTMSIKDN
jgi:L-aspartate oxidase